MAGLELGLEVPESVALVQVTLCLPSRTERSLDSFALLFESASSGFCLQLRPGCLVLSTVWPVEGMAAGLL